MNVDSHVIQAAATSLTGTTMHSMPGLPILHSSDLVNWRFLGYALDRLDLGPMFVSLRGTTTIVVWSHKTGG